MQFVLLFGWESRAELYLPAAHRTFWQRWEHFLMARKNRFGYKRQFTSPRRPLGRRRRAADGLRASSLGVEWLEERAMLAAGSLDTTFNPGGAVPGTLISSLGFVET